MRAVLQRVSRAQVRIEGREVAGVGQGLVVFVGVAAGDGSEDAVYLAEKIAGLRIMPDGEGRMNRSVLEVEGELLLVSQFTLLAETRKGRRPSFTAAADPDVAAPLLDELADNLRARGAKVQTGEFGAMMDVELVNHGPVTITIDSRDRSTPRRRA